MFDAHNHLQFEEFDADRDDVVARAIDAGVSGMVLAGYDSKRRDLAGRLAERSGIWASAGLHPWALSGRDHDDVRRELDALADADWGRFCAVGELGIDGAIDVDHDLQVEVFRAQLALARELDLPIVVHCVRANTDVARILANDSTRGTRGIIHSFWGSREEARRFVNLGMSLSIGTQLTRSRPEKMERALHEVGVQHLLIESDAPSRPPAGVETSRNEPGYLPCVARSLALVLGIEVDDAAETTEENARRIFDLGAERLTLEEH